MAANATFSEPWTGTLTQLEWPSTPRLLLITLINFPVLSIVLNVLWQLVSVFQLVTLNTVQTTREATPLQVTTSHGLALDTLPGLRTRLRSRPNSILQKLPREGTLAYVPTHVSTNTCSLVR